MHYLKSIERGFYVSRTVSHVRHGQKNGQQRSAWKTEPATDRAGKRETSRSQPDLPVLWWADNWLNKAINQLTFRLLENLFRTHESPSPVPGGCHREFGFCGRVGGSFRIQTEKVNWPYCTSFLAWFAFIAAKHLKVPRFWGNTWERKNITEFIQKIKSLIGKRAYIRLMADFI